MESETQISCLMDSIDVSIGALGDIEAEIIGYEETITHVKNSIEKIEEENSQMGTAAKNNQLLLTELTNLIQALDFPHFSVLASADLNTPEGIKTAAKAAFRLRDALHIDVRLWFKFIAKLLIILVLLNLL